MEPGPDAVERLGDGLRRRRSRRSRWCRRPAWTNTGRQPSSMSSASSRARARPRPWPAWPGRRRSSAPRPRRRDPPSSRPSPATSAPATSRRPSTAARPTPLCRTSPPLARWSAASSAVKVAVDAVSWMTPPPGRAAAGRLLGQAERLGQPVDDDLLDLGDRRAGGPDHPLRADAAGEQVAEDRGRRRVGREVGEEARVLPVRQAGHDDLVEVGEQGVERLARPRAPTAGSARRTSPGATCESTGRSSRRGPVVGDPVDGGVALAAELLGRHVAGSCGPKVLRAVERAYSGTIG